MPLACLLALLCLLPLGARAQPAETLMVRKHEPQTVRLLEPGHRPHKALRYRWKRAPAKAFVSTEGGWELFAQGMRNDHLFPLMKLELRSQPPVAQKKSTVVALEWLAPVLSAPEGSAQAPPVDPATRQTLEALEGVRSELRLSQTGLLLGLEQWPSPKDSVASAGRQMQVRSVYALELARGVLEQLLVPFPEEPIGPGARWQVEVPAVRGTLPLIQVTTYQLVSIKGREVELSYRLGAKPDPATPVPRDEINVEQSGSGKVRLSLDSPFPIEGSEEAFLRGQFGGKTRAAQEHRGRLRRTVSSE